MKFLAVISVLLFLIVFNSFSQGNYKEIICPCMLEFDIPKSFTEKGLLQRYGGIPVLKLDEAKVENDKLVCVYKKSFFTDEYLNQQNDNEGFGFCFDEAQNNVPYDLRLQLVDDYLDGWNPSKSQLVLKHTYHDCVVYTVQRCAGEVNAYSFSGAFYSPEYEGDAIQLSRKYEGVARVNSKKNGFQVAASASDFYTVAPNPNAPVNTPKVKKPIKNFQKKQDIKKVKRPLRK